MKKDYLLKICYKLNERGFTEYNAEDILSTDRQPFSADSGEVAKLGWLPEENLKKIAEYDISNLKDFGSVYQAWGREGFFKYKPYIVAGDPNTTMCVRHNRFMHMFRGYYFQISGTPDGDGDNGHGLMRTDKFLHIMRDKYASKSHLGFIILYAAMIDCGFQNDNFRNLFYSDKSIVDNYFQQSMSFWKINTDYGYDIVGKYMSYRDGSINPKECGHNVYCFRDRHGVFCRFWLSSDAVEVEYCFDKDSGVGRSRIVRFDIPDPTVGIDQKRIDMWDEDDLEDFKESFKEACFPKEKIEYFILLMLLKLVGIHSCHVSSYPIKKIGYIKEDMTAATIHKFSQITD